MEYELINPSDPYTFIADDFEVAALVVLAFGTSYGAKPKEGTDRVPILMFTDAEKWYQDQFGRSPEEGLRAKKNALAEALDSMMLGEFEDRKRYETALASIAEPEKKVKFIEKWQDECSSLNNIGGKAHAMAKAIMADRNGE